MIPLFLFGTCGKAVDEPWEVEVFGERERPVVSRTVPSVEREPLVSTQWQDQETDLSLHLPDGWQAWPGAPAAEVRLHMEHPQSGVQLRIFATNQPREWPSEGACVWNFEDEGGYSWLRVPEKVTFASCWPEIPGGERRSAWRFEAPSQFWLVEARIPGGQAGIGEEALEAVLSGLHF